MIENADNISDSRDDQRIIVPIDPDLEELIPGFFEYRRRDIVTMRQALEAGDLETVRIRGHGMKGAGGGYGFPYITEIGRALELAAKLGDSATIMTQIDELEHYLDRVEVVYED